MRLSMYDVRCTMYDLRIRARCAGRTGSACAHCPEGGGAWRRPGADGVCLCTMYNTHDGPKQLLGSCSCTMDDFRCTTEAPGGAYVRCTTYDVRLPSSRALRGEDGWRGEVVFYSVRSFSSNFWEDEARTEGSSSIPASNREVFTTSLANRRANSGLSCRRAASF